MTLSAADDAGRFKPDYYIDMSEYSGVYAMRAQSSAKARYDAIHVTREDKEGLAKGMRQNLNLFSAPHVALLFMPAGTTYGWPAI